MWRSAGEFRQLQAKQGMAGNEFEPVTLEAKAAGSVLLSSVKHGIPARVVALIDMIRSNPPHVYHESAWQVLEASSGRPVHYTTIQIFRRRTQAGRDNLLCGG